MLMEMDLHTLQQMWQKNVILIYTRLIIKTLAGQEAKKEGLFNLLILLSNKLKISLIIF